MKQARHLSENTIWKDFVKTKDGCIFATYNLC